MEIIFCDIQPRLVELIVPPKQKAFRKERRIEKDEEGNTHTTDELVEYSVEGENPLSPFIKQLQDKLEARTADICTITADAVVSPANSFGWMDGGVDAAYMVRFPGIQDKVQTRIASLPFGELLVGQAVTVETGDKNIPHLIVAPTMRVPSPIPLASNVLLAARAAMGEAMSAGFKRVAFPGMGSGTGQVAWESVVLGMLAGIATARGKPFTFEKWHPFYVPT